MTELEDFDTILKRRRFLGARRKLAISDQWQPSSIAAKKFALLDITNQIFAVECVLRSVGFAVFHKPTPLRLGANDLHHNKIQE
ncbi:MAG: hypothetical protein R8G34_08905 [Paracoccaceae bacterium]|nr:hypothetical protein [Paracoccaceae bacterium]